VSLAKFRWSGDERVNLWDRRIRRWYFFEKRTVLQLLLGLRKRVEGVLEIYGNGPVGNTD
jgi:hypothetical protein